MAIGDRIIRQTGKIIHVVHMFSPVPYDWDFERNCAVFKSSWLRHRCFVLATAAGIAYDAFSLYGSYKAWSSADLPEHAKLGIYFPSLRLAMISLINFTMLRNYWCNHLIINELFRFVREFGAEFSYNRPSKAFLLILYMYEFNYVLTLSTARAVFKDPGNYRLLTSLTLEPEKLSIGVKFLFFLVHLELQAIKIAMTFVATATVLGYMAFATRIIERFRFEYNGGYSMNYRQIYRKYRQLRILQKLYDQGFSGYFFSAVTSITILVVLCIYQAVLFSKPYPAILGSILLTLELTLIKMNGAVHEVSSEVQKSWKLIAAPAWFHKWVKSLQPVNVKMGNFFYFDRGMRLTVLDVIVSTAVSLIVSRG